jgi:hypothetical protein
MPVALTSRAARHHDATPRTKDELYAIKIWILSGYGSRLTGCGVYFMTADGEGPQEYRRIGGHPPGKLVDKPWTSGSLPNIKPTMDGLTLSRRVQLRMNSPPPEDFH